MRNCVKLCPRDPEARGSVQGGWYWLASEKTSSGARHMIDLDTGAGVSLGAMEDGKEHGAGKSRQLWCEAIPVVLLWEEETRLGKVGAERR